MKNIDELSKKLERLIGTQAQSTLAEPPRLVRANSAFELYAAIEKAKSHPDLMKAIG